MNVPWQYELMGFLRYDYLAILANEVILLREEGFQQVIATIECSAGSRRSCVWLMKPCIQTRNKHRRP